MILLATRLEDESRTCLFASKSSASNDRCVGPELRSTPARRQRGAASSRSSDAAKVPPRTEEEAVNKSITQLANPALHPSQHDTRSSHNTSRPARAVAASKQPARIAKDHEQPDAQVSGDGGNSRQAVKKAPSFATTKSKSSPYFSPSLPTATESAAQEKKRKRPPAGTVSCVPFPPLGFPRFGIIQEQMAREPFWLLIVVTFLIKTKGQIAVPVFRNVRDRFPSPAQLADPANTAKLSDMVRHLGLVSQRARFIQRYARMFLQQPRAGVRFKVSNYAGRVSRPRPGAVLKPEATEDPQSETSASDDDPVLWDIGHMTQGSYAIDSWRIFCRDELLGRAENWKGTGRQPDFQPEWTRVMPRDKELRAYLRWMWMRKGWQWDPETGKRSVLRDDLRRAVDEGRVDYDQTGGLRILDEI